MSKVAFQKEINNPLGEETTWIDHELMVVGIHKAYRFNRASVPGVINIIQLEEGDCEYWRDTEEEKDFRELFGPTIQTTAAGARALATVLLEAADAAETLPGEKE